MCPGLCVILLSIYRIAEHPQACPGHEGRTFVAVGVQQLLAGVLSPPVAHDVPHDLRRRIRLQAQGVGVRPRHPVACMC